MSDYYGLGGGLTHTQHTHTYTHVYKQHTHTPTTHTRYKTTDTPMAIPTTHITHTYIPYIHVIVVTQA